MIIGIPKEIKNQEFRVALTPDGARQLVKAGFVVQIEKNAGIGSGFSNRDYQEACAKIVQSHERLFKTSEFIIKVKEPLPSEYPLLKKDQILFAFLHLAANPTLEKVLKKKSVYAIAYEAVASPDGSLPILKPMSEIAGRISVMTGAFYLQKGQGGSGILISGTPNVKGGHVVILGAGVVGENALQMAIGLGARVSILDRDKKRLQEIIHAYKGTSIEAALTAPNHIDKIVSNADLVIGGVHNAGEKTPKLVKKETVYKMKTGSVIVDVAIDQGGCFETSRVTSHSDPIYLVNGVIHYCVPNMPGAVPQTATAALTAATLPYIRSIAKNGLEKACRLDPGLACAILT
ncbi:MAG: alanine dehydrogenase [Nitrospirota bacterium]